MHLILTCMRGLHSLKSAVIVPVDKKKGKKEGWRISLLVVFDRILIDSIQEMTMNNICRVALFLAGTAQNKVLLLIKSLKNMRNFVGLEKMHDQCIIICFRCIYWRFKYWIWWVLKKNKECVGIWNACKWFSMDKTKMGNVLLAACRYK